MTQFKDPPPKDGEKWNPVVRALKQNPGKWALVLETTRTSVPNAVRNQSIAVLRARAGIEIRTANETREPGNRTCDMYLRYNPHKDEALSGHERRTAIAEFDKNTGGNDG